MNDETNDEPVGPDPTEELPPPPPPGDTGDAGRSARPRRLRRSNDDRMIAGVSGGIAEYFGIDPIIVRLVFVALVLLGGSGIGLYLIAWLVMPREWEDESAAVNALRGGRRAGGRALAAMGVLLAGVIVLSGSLFWLPVGDGLFLPLLILAAGIALLVWPSEGSSWHARWHLDREEWRAEQEGVRHEFRRERDELRQGWGHGYQRGVRTTEPAAQPAPQRPPRRPKPAPFLGPIGLACVLIYAGLSVFADRVGWWHTDPASFFAIALMIVGGVLVVSAFIGRARGLIWLGVLLLPIAWAVAAIDLTWWDGVGEESITVTELDELEDEYRWGIGQFHVDLSDLELDGSTQEVAIGLTIGELVVWVPDSVALDLDLDGRAGSVIFTDEDGRTNDDGMDVDLERSLDDADTAQVSAGTLVLDVDVGLGEAEVIVCGSETVPCP